ncbi:MAG: 3-isopropylmalate dehydratase [Candidatus Thermoplasmatota archaeon]|nr:3-isopropylmalate dehydratase [Candidatus Thermoplasmatota archaeon]
MKRVITGRAWVFGDNINTDLMYPHICYTLPEGERPKYTMWANRPGWPEIVSRGDILVAGKNFGLGSSRPAASNLLGVGISAVIAESLNGLFLRNAVNVGLPAVSSQVIRSMVTEGDLIEIDLTEGNFRNLSTGGSVAFRSLPEFLMDVIDAGGIIEILKRSGCLDTEAL